MSQKGGPLASVVAAFRNFLRLMDEAAQSGDSFAVETTPAPTSYLSRTNSWRAVGSRTILHPRTPDRQLP